jgi:hypothetical protein
VDGSFEPTAARYYDFETVDQVRKILMRAARPPEIFEEFEHGVRGWS